MKKVALVAAIVAAGAAGYWYSQHQGVTSTGANAVLDYIPADTVLFSGQMKPFPLKSYLHSIAGQYRNMDADTLASLSDAFDAQEPSQRFLLSLYKTYLSSLKQPEQLLTTFGFPSNIQGFVYTLGAVPVMKVQVEKPEAFWAALDNAEQESGFSHQTRQLAGLEYRVYTLTELDTGTSPAQPIELIFAQKEGMLTITLNTPLNDPDLLEMAFELKKPTESLAASGVLTDIAKTHGFMDDSISFLNHVEIAKALTSSTDNLLSKQLTKLFTLVGEDPLIELKTPECKAEFTAIAANWPRTVVGLNSYSVTDKQMNMDSALIVETKNATILAALQKMRGFIPHYVKDVESVLTVGLGINVGEFAPALTEVWSDLQTPTLECEPLAQLQSELAEVNPAMLGMFTGMAASVKGIGLSVLDYQLGQQDDEPTLESLDALISVSADNPAMLFNMLKPFEPSFADIQLTESSEPVDLGALLMLPPEVNVKPMLAIKGQHLVVYAGDKGKAAADKLAKDKLAVNGLLHMGADYGKLFKPAIALLEMSGEPIPEDIKLLKDSEMRMSVALDMTAKGVEIGTVVSASSK